MNIEISSLKGQEDQKKYLNNDNILMKVSFLRSYKKNINYLF